MPISFPSDYWLTIPGGTYRLGLEPGEAHRLAEMSAGFRRAEESDQLDETGERDRRCATTGNVEWVENRLRVDCPLRECVIEEFTIARRPVSNAEYAALVSEAGAARPAAWAYGRVDDDAPVMGVGWSDAVAFAQWANCRLPFEAEWERAARGPDRRLFPWGDEFGELGAWTQLQPIDVPVAFSREDRRRLATPEGLEMFAARAPEWCLDLWTPPVGADESEWRRRWDAKPWWRVTRGCEVDGIIPNAVLRLPGAVEPIDSGTKMIRLVRADGRGAPNAPPMTGWSAAAPTIATFETSVVVPALRRAVADGRLADHDVELHSDAATPRARTLTDADRLSAKLRDSHRDVYGTRISHFRDAYVGPAARPAYGLRLSAVSRERLRRVVPQHGIFLWTLIYRIASDDQIAVHPVVFYRMAFDGRLHRFDHRFTPAEPETPIQNVSSDVVQRHLIESFQFYELHADGDRPPW